MKRVSASERLPFCSSYRRSNVVELYRLRVCVCVCVEADRECKDRSTGEDVMVQRGRRRAEMPNSEALGVLAQC